MGKKTSSAVVRGQGVVVEERKKRRLKKKKKGRPSLLDLQKRTIKQQELQLLHIQRKFQKQRNPNPSPANNTTSICSNSSNTTTVGVIGSTITSSLPIAVAPPLQQSLPLKNDNFKNSSSASTPVTSARRRSTRRNPDLFEEAEDKKFLNNLLLLQSDEVVVGVSHEKPKTSTANLKTEKHNVSPSYSTTQPLQETLSELELGPFTPLPDKKLLLVILDRLQKKDTYGVFAEPVDLEELPDYHDVISHPMDFGTIRNKLANAAYSSLEQFEKDVFLICSNAMQYNAPSTVYFRQARSIQELAKKKFENLRQEVDKKEPPKLLQGGLTMNSKELVGTASLERTSSEILSCETLMDNSRPADDSQLSGAALCIDKAYPSSLKEQNLQKTDGHAGLMSKSKWMKQKTNLGREGSRRNTYKKSYLPAGALKPSVLKVFDAERKQLLAVGLHAEYGYARSVARFAANLGPVAWNVAFKKIGKSLPAGVQFGPGWVGEKDMVRQNWSPPNHQSSVSQPVSLLTKPGSAKFSCLEIEDRRANEHTESHTLSENLVPSMQEATESMLDNLGISNALTS